MLNILGKKAHGRHVRDADSNYYRNNVAPCYMAAQVQEIVTLLKEQHLSPLLSETGSK